MDEVDSAGAYALVYSEAVRALTQQREALDAVRGRAALMLSAAAVASSLLGGQGLARGHLGAFGWLAVIAFAALAVMLLAILWPPRSEWTGILRPSQLIKEDLEVPDPLPVSMIYRELALHMDRAYVENRPLHRRLARLFRTATLLLSVEVVAWIVELAAG